jgi:hypothetical protein
VHVDFEHMRAGGNGSYNAAWVARDGADKFSRVAVDSGIFGDFPEAGTFHEALTASHADHVDRMRGHEATLDKLGAKVHEAADRFGAMEDHNESMLQALRCTLST